MKTYTLNQVVAGCVDAYFMAVSFAEQGEFDTAREILRAWDRGDTPNDGANGGKE